MSGSRGDSDPIPSIGFGTVERFVSRFHQLRFVIGVQGVRGNTAGNGHRAELLTLVAENQVLDYLPQGVGPASGGGRVGIWKHD
ncbi:MAG TPA: hypothetical protein VNE82_08605 [Candidatus Binataceae bacterium]|nr:hypothetical protein [Candidatus Binataceae bacterium]